MDKLYIKKCISCEGNIKPLIKKEVSLLMQNIKEWKVVGGKKIRKVFTFNNFNEAMGFVNKVAKIADTEGHHPDILISYNKVKLELFTHAINGLSENDFILASKIDNL